MSGSIWQGGVTTAAWMLGQLLNKYCYPADGVFNYYSFSLCYMYLLTESFSENHSSVPWQKPSQITLNLCSAVPLDWDIFFKPRKINLRAFSYFPWKFPAIIGYLTMDSGSNHVFTYKIDSSVFPLCTLQDFMYFEEDDWSWAVGQLTAKITDTKT